MASTAKRGIPVAWRDRAGRTKCGIAPRLQRAFFGIACAVGVFVFPAIFAQPAHVNAAPRVETRVALEYEVKAAFLFNFARFVEWPRDSAAPADKFVIAIFEDDEFSKIVARTVVGKVLHGRNIEVHALRGGTGSKNYQILFIGDADPTRLASIVQDLRTAPVLTVTDLDDASGVPEVVRFFMEDRRVRFEIDLNAADRAGLMISSKLLSVARLVRDPGHGGR